MKRYFVVGTDTDCGKTYITSRLAQYFPHAAAIKPVASGCTVHGQELLSADALQLQQAVHLSLSLINPWRFKQPVSPHIAAQEEGARLCAQEIADYCLNLPLEDVTRLFIEGAGGLLVPLNEKETWLDFLKETGFPVILVVGMKLGCINHALLTSAVLQFYEIPCLGWVANCIDPHMLALAENCATLKEKLPMPLLATVPFGGELGQLQEDLFN